MLDALSASKNPAHKNLFKKLLNAIGISTNYKGLNKKTAITMEYFKDKFEGDDRTMPDEPDAFTAVDEILSTLGKNVKKDVYNNTKYLINQFVNYMSQGKTQLEKDYEKEDFEKKLMVE